MDIDILLTGGVSIVTATIGSWVSWVLARRKYHSEVDNQLITNMKESLEFYKHLSDDNKDRLTQVLEQNREILEQNAQLLEQNTKLENKVHLLEEELKQLNKKLITKKMIKNDTQS